MPRVLYPGYTRFVTLVALIWAVLGPGLVRGQPGDEPPGLPETVAAYELIEPWVRALAVPEGATGPEVVGACVTLRFDGRLVGQGTIFGGGSLSLPEATRIAVGQARERLPVTRDAMAEDRLLIAAQQMTVSLELAGAGVPVEKPTQADLVATFSPGVHGVAVRFGDLAAAVYPAQMLWTSQDVPGALRRLIVGVTGDQALALRPIEEVLEGAQMRVLRFRTRHVAQLSPGGEARLLQRGGRFVSSADVRSMDALVAWAEGLGEFVIGQRDVGVYLPVSGTVRSAPSPLQRALRMYSFTEVHLVGWNMDFSKRARAEAAYEARKILGAWDAGEAMPAAVVSLLAVSLEKVLFNADWEAARARVLAELQRLAADIESVPVPERPMVAWALVELGRKSEARAIMPVCRRSSHPGELVERMPWLGFAEIELAGEEGVASAPALREMREMMWRLQVTRADLAASDADMAGGVVFSRSLTRLPTWQVARPLAFMGPMLAEPSLTEAGEVPGEMARLFESLRFLRQLSAGAHEGHMYAPGEAWLWGVRPGVWDQSMPIETSAMTLICVCRTIRGLEVLEARLKRAAEAETGAAKGE